MTVFVTGVSGYVGRHLFFELNRRGVKCLGGVRSRLNPAFAGANYRELGDITQLSSNVGVFDGVSTVVHLANLPAPPPNLSQIMAREELIDINVRGTEKVLRSAARSGVKRFIYVSSLKAVGERTSLSAGFSEKSVPRPEGVYGQSKLAAEQVVQSIAPQLGIEYVIIRPPLIYGPGVEGNFSTIVKLVGKRIPLPFRAVRNARSMVFIGNLIDLIVTCLDHPKASNQLLMVSDGEDLSLPSLLHHIASGLDQKDINFWCPEFLLHSLARVLGKHDVAQKLLGTLLVDMSTTNSLLDWYPPYSVEQGIGETVGSF